jgi:hypothetical protein
LQLSGTKDSQNKSTLMHYLVDTIERKFPELLTFYDEISHVDRASRVSKDALKKSLDAMEMNVKDLEKDLKNNKVRQSEDDKFIEVMGVSFIEFISIYILVFSFDVDWFKPSFLNTYIFCGCIVSISVYETI